MSHYAVQNDPSAAYLRQPSSSPVMHRASIPSSNASASGGHPTPFKAPAHKHAHHLHSIPPREKSTRTLIIDHLLWVHARTRFAQARAELGMIDRTGGPSSPNYTHRERPENYEENEEVYSDGEDVAVLTARAGGPGHTHGDEEDERLDMQNLVLARSLRQRAEAVEKVTTSMLDQPPEVPPIHPDDLLDLPTSPQLQPQNPGRNQHTLPNGVRLRLALATVVNDLFSRRAPSVPSQQPAKDGSNRHAPAPNTAPPSSLLSLASISSGLMSLSNANGTGAQRRLYPNDYIRSLYDIGADPDTQNSPPSLRCPRHLHMGCEICVEAKTHPPARPGQPRSRSQGRTGSSTGSSPADVPPGGPHGAGHLVGGVTGWQDGSGIGSGLARPGPRGTVLRRPSNAQAPSHVKVTGSENGPPMSSTKLVELVVRFMRLSALVAMELGREATEDRASVDGGDGRRDDETAPNAGSSASSNRPPSSPQTSPRTLTHRNLLDAGFNYYSFRPSREWYYLLAGLLTRAVFEGYMTAGWRGIEPLEILLGVGLGIHPLPRVNGAGRERQKDPNNPDDLDEDEEFKVFDPDDLPELEEAAKVLFPALRDTMSGGPNGMLYRREGAELEYEVEMVERLQRFYEVPASTPDLATHLEDLQWQFPSEAVERAAVRFCEAIARWRGKPELETYKKASWITGQRERKVSGGAAMSIDALVHSNPTSPSNHNTNHEHQPAPPPFRSEPPRHRKPPIEKYFSAPQSLDLNRRRRRSGAERMVVDETQRMQQNPAYA